MATEGIHRFALPAKVLLLPALLWTAQSFLAPGAGAQTYSDEQPGCLSEADATPYIPVDSWIYPALLRLKGMGYAEAAFEGMRPWSRIAVGQMLDEALGNIQDAEAVSDPSAPEARAIYNQVARAIGYRTDVYCLADVNRSVVLESAYTTVRAVSGPVLRDSFHLGSTVVNDFGRPIENGWNSDSGWSGFATAGRFAFYLRGEFETADSAGGYSTSLAQALSKIDAIPFVNPSTGTPYGQATIPLGPLAAQAHGRVLEGYVTARVLAHTVSFGKQDEWLGPAQGGAMAYSNNAENIYALHLTRSEPLYVPGLSRIAGPFRYEFMVGGLRGHTYVPASTNVRVLPGAPWMHLEKISLEPTSNFSVGFERTVIWGGKGHEPITLKTFLRSFFSVSAPTTAVKVSSKDPRARFGAFDFSYRLPYLRHWLTLYADSEAHDDVNPIDAPRRACFRTGLYLSHVPKLPKLDLRAEAISTDPSVSPSQGGKYEYYEGIVRQGYTNQGQLFGDWIGREDKGGQAWAGWHLSPNEWIQVSFRSQKAAKDFIPGGTTLNDVGVEVVKRLSRDLELNGQFNYERWKAGIYPTGTAATPAAAQTTTATRFQLTWFPNRKVKF